MARTTEQPTRSPVLGDRACGLARRQRTLARRRTHSQLASFIWSICNLLRGPYKHNEYRKVILPLTVLRRFDCLLAPTKAEVLAEHAKIKTKPETVVRSLLAASARACRASTTARCSSCSTCWPRCARPRKAAAAWRDTRQEE